MNDRTSRIGALATIRTGKLDANRSVADGQYPFFTCAVNPLRIDTFAFSGKAVLVAGNGDLNVKYYEGRFNAYQRTYVIQSRDEDVLHPKYLAAFLESYLESLRRLSIGGVIKYIKLGDLTEALIPLPPIGDQRRIAAILDHADDLRRKRRLAREKLNALPQAIFHEMFGDPVTNEMGWPTKPTGAVVNVIGGFAFKSTDFADAGPGIVRISNIRDGGLDLTDIARIPMARVGKGAKFEIGGGDILMAMSGATTGKVGVAPLELPDPLFQNQRVANFRISAPRLISREFLIVLLRSDYYQTTLWQAAGGVAQPNVSSGQLGAIPIPLPPIDEQDAFSQRVLKIEPLGALHSSQLKTLDKLFASLQSSAFAGNLTSLRPVPATPASLGRKSLAPA